MNYGTRVTDSIDSAAIGARLAHLIFNASASRPDIGMARYTTNSLDTNTLLVAASSRLSNHSSEKHGIMVADADDGAEAHKSIWLALVVTQSLIFLLALLCNAVVLLALFIYGRRKKLSRMYLFIANLSAADMAVACFNVLPNLIQLIFRMHWLVASDILCKVVHYFSVAAIYAATYVLVMTAVDRYVAICHPLASQGAAGGRRVLIMVATAWAAALVFSIPQLVIFRYSETGQPGSGMYDCWSSFADFAGDDSSAVVYETVYTIWFVVAVWIFPVIVLAFCYISITVIVWKNRNFVVKTKAPTRAPNRGIRLANASGGCNAIYNNNRRHSKSGLPAAAIKTVRLTLTVVLCYIVCWSPWMVSMLYLMANISPDEEKGVAIAVAGLLSYLIGINSCINPWIYFCFNFQRLRSARGLARRDSSCRTVTSTSVGLVSPASNNEMQLGLLSNT